MDGLRQYCKQRVEQGEAAQLIDPLLDLIEQMNDRLVRLEHRVAQLQQAQYGSKRERVSSGQLQLALLQLPAHDSVVELQADLEGDKPEKPARPKQPRTPRHIPPSIPRQTILSEPPEACKWCADCGREKKYIGSEYAEVLEFKPGEFFVERTERRKYACLKCQNGVVIGPGPHRVLDQAMPGAGLVAEVVVRKYADHCPLERQSRIFASATESRYRPRSWATGWAARRGCWSRYTRNCFGAS